MNHFLINLEKVSNVLYYNINFIQLNNVCINYNLIELKIWRALC